MTWNKIEIKCSIKTSLNYFLLLMCKIYIHSNRNTAYVYSVHKVLKNAVDLRRFAAQVGRFVENRTTCCAWQDMPYIVRFLVYSIVRNVSSNNICCEFEDCCAL